MRSSLWFVMPVHGRLDLAALCLRQLRSTCDQLADADVDASAVIVADRENLDGLRDRILGLLGFGHVERDNWFLSRRFNDGIQLALDPRHNARPADYVVPIGSDDWIDHRILLPLPDDRTVIGYQHVAFVREDGREMTYRHLDYTGGCGIRVYPRALMEPLGWRPADEDRKRACDTSILRNVTQANPGLRVSHRDVDPRQIVDWKSAGEQLNPYAGLRLHPATGTGDPFSDLAGVYPAALLDEMRDLYRSHDRELAAA